MVETRPICFCAVKTQVAAGPKMYAFAFSQNTLLHPNGSTFAHVVTLVDSDDFLLGLRSFEQYLLCLRSSVNTAGRRGVLFISLTVHILYTPCAWLKKNKCVWFCVLLAVTPVKQFIRENPIEMDDLGVPPLMETPNLVLTNYIALILWGDCLWLCQTQTHPRRYMLWRSHVAYLPSNKSCGQQVSPIIFTLASRENSTTLAGSDKT